MSPRAHRLVIQIDAGDYSPPSRRLQIAYWGLGSGYEGLCSRDVPPEINMPGRGRLIDEPNSSLLNSQYLAGVLANPVDLSRHVARRRQQRQNNDYSCHWL